MIYGMGKTINAMTPTLFVLYLVAGSSSGPARRANMDWWSHNDQAAPMEA